LRAGFDGGGALGLQFVAGKRRFVAHGLAPARLIAKTRVLLR